MSSRRLFIFVWEKRLREQVGMSRCDVPARSCAGGTVFEILRIHYIPRLRRWYAAQDGAARHPPPTTVFFYFRAATSTSARFLAMCRVASTPRQLVLG
jgi:hypothetical protein